MQSATIFSLGVMPYISASIIFSLLSKAVPALEKIAKEGQSGQRRINQYTRLATVGICLVQRPRTASCCTKACASGSASTRSW
jgi:preprotein translocase subunit SecY